MLNNKTLMNEKCIYSYQNFFTLFVEALKVVLNKKKKIIILNDILNEISKKESIELSKSDKIKWLNFCIFELKLIS